MAPLVPLGGLVQFRDRTSEAFVALLWTRKIHSPQMPLVMLWKGHPFEDV